MQLQPLNPRMKVLYMSGYPDPNKLNAVLASNAVFIQKPFTKQKLLTGCEKCWRASEVFIGRRNEIVMLSDEVNVLLVAVFVGLCFHRLRPHRATGPSLNAEESASTP